MARTKKIPSNKNVFYVYVLLDPRKPGTYKYGEYSFDYEPFYIGKGKDNRYRVTVSEAKRIKKSNRFVINKIKKIIKEIKKEPIIQKIIKDIIEAKAFENEIKAIKVIGRSDLKLGPLCNHTDGGDGGSGITEKERKRKSKKMLGKNNPNYGKHHTPEIIEFLRKLATGRKKNKEEIKKFTNRIKESWKQKGWRENFHKKMAGENNPMFGKKGKDSPNWGLKRTKKHKKKLRDLHLKKYQIITPDNKKYIVDYGIPDFLKEHTEYKISDSTLYDISKGRIKKSKWRVQEIFNE